MDRSGFCRGCSYKYLLCPGDRETSSTRSGKQLWHSQTQNQRVTPRCIPHDGQSVESRRAIHTSTRITAAQWDINWTLNVCQCKSPAWAFAQGRYQAAQMWVLWKHRMAGTAYRIGIAPHHRHQRRSTTGKPPVIVSKLPCVDRQLSREKQR